MGCAARAAARNGGWKIGRISPFHRPNWLDLALQTPEKRKIYRTQPDGSEFCKWLIVLGDAGALTIQVIHKWLNAFVWQSAGFSGFARFAARGKTAKAEAAGPKPRAARGDGECAEMRAHRSFAGRENLRPVRMTSLPRMTLAGSTTPLHWRDSPRLAAHHRHGAPHKIRRSKDLR